ncbi:MAG TPA: hypothetical protein PKY82_31300, partial [Pyrinomonadaceae bacterium]|nr:hypothetical protein [Pyrinomonadaceae bacterium]
MNLQIVKKNEYQNYLKKGSPVNARTTLNSYCVRDLQNVKSEKLKQIFAEFYQFAIAPLRQDLVSRLNDERTASIRFLPDDLTLIVDKHQKEVGLIQANTPLSLNYQLFNRSFLQSYFISKSSEFITKRKAELLNLFFLAEETQIRLKNAVINQEKDPWNNYFHGENFQLLGEIRVENEDYLVFYDSELFSQHYCF